MEAYIPWNGANDNNRMLSFTNFYLIKTRNWTHIFTVVHDRAVVILNVPVVSVHEIIVVALLRVDILQQQCDIIIPVTTTLLMVEANCMTQLVQND